MTAKHFYAMACSPDGRYLYATATAMSAQRVLLRGVTTAEARYLRVSTTT